MFDGRFIDHMFTVLILIGIGFGVILCGVGWLIYWLCSHVKIEWVS